jgi:phosphoribosylanthranilate isomerase
MTAIKICGIKDLAHGVVAIDGGADYLGFIFYPPSHRALEPDQAASLIAGLRAARPGGWHAVGVFVNEPLALVAQIAEQCGLDAVQLNGDESASYIAQLHQPVFKAVRVVPGTEASIPDAGSFGAARILLDANVPGQWGGTGKTVAWAEVGRAVADGFLAGGLTPDNVEAAILATRPWGVDVSSGVEREREKDAELITRFIAAVHRADERATAGLVPSAGRGEVR